jgi:rhomboid protease GluP
MSLVFRFSAKYALTYLLIAVNIAVYIYTSILSGNFLVTDIKVAVQYGQYNRGVLEYGWYWQLLTAMFVHANLIHIVGNMLFLLIFGLRAEEMFRPYEYLSIYILAGLAGNLLTLYLSIYPPLLPLDYVSVGASGAIFGMFGAVTIYIRRALSQPMTSALIYAFLLLMLSAGLNVNIWAHLGGLVVGLLMGYAFAETRRRRVTYAYRYSYSR